MVAQSQHPGEQQEHLEFKASLGYIARPYLKKENES
jgi:hypothetical protein